MFGKKYLEIGSAEKMRAKAMTDPVPEKKKGKIIAKIPHIKDENKLFYYACSGDPEIRKAAISHLESPLAIRELIEIFSKDPEILKICVDNPNIDEDLLLHICQKRESGFDLRQYIISQKLQSVDSLIKCTQYMIESSELQLCALARLTKLEDMTRVLMEGSSKIVDETMERIQQKWPMQADQVFENLVLYFARNRDWFNAARLNRKIRKKGKIFDKSILDSIKADNLLKNDDFNSKFAAELLSDIHDEKLLFDFASNYDVDSSGEAGERGDVIIMKAVMGKLTDEQLLAIINDHDSEHHEKRQAAVPYLSPGALMAIAMSDRELKYEAAEELSEEEKSAFVKDTSHSRELRVAMIQHIKDGSELTNIVLSCIRNDDLLLLEEVVNSISDKSVLRSVCENDRVLDSIRFKAAMKLRDQELIAEYVLHSWSESLQKQALSVITDPELLRKIAAGHTSLHIRWCAAWRVGDDAMRKEIESHSKERVNGHVVYVTVNDPWVEYQEKCMRCGKKYGRTDDSETTRHYGELFTHFSCTPAVNRLDAIRWKT